MDYPQAGVIAGQKVPRFFTGVTFDMHQGTFYFLCLLIMLVLLVGLYVSFIPSLLTFFTLLVGTIMLPIAFRYPSATFYALLIMRSTVDVVAEDAVISLGGFGLNLSSLMGIFLIFWGGWFITVRRFTLRIPGICILALFLFIGITGLATSLQPAHTVQELIKIVDYIILFVLGYAVTTSFQNYRILLVSTCAAIIIPSIIGIIQLIEQLPFPPEGHIRLMGTFAHPNAFAFALVLSISTWMMLYAFRSIPVSSLRFLAWRKDMPYRIMFVVLGVLILDTFTRGAWIGALLILLVVGFRYARRFSIIAALILMACFQFYPHIKQVVFAMTGFQVTSIPFVQRIDPSSEDAGSYHWRRRSWMEMSVKLSSVPLFGYGLGTFQKLRGGTITYLTDLGAVEAHNDYLRLAIETGYGGVIVYALFYVYVIVRTGIASFRTSDKCLQRIFTIMAACTASFMLMSSADNLLRATAAMWVLWTLMGATLALIGITQTRAVSRI